MRSYHLALLASVFALCGGCSEPDAERTTDTAPATPVTTPEATEEPGPTACSEGFASEAGACVAILPAAACTGATRASIGKSACVPIDDCSAPLPEGATVVTDPSQLQATIDAADSGSTIALEPGKYPGVVIQKNLTIVGRCAERVVLDGGGKGRGIDIKNLSTVAVRSLSITNFELAIAVPKGVKSTSVLEGSHLLISNNRLALSVYGKATLSESVVEGVSSTNDESGGIWAIEGGKVEITGVESRGTVGAVIAQGAGTSVVVRSSALGYTGAVRANYLVAALGGASVVIEQSSLRSRSMGLSIVGSSLAGKPVGTAGAVAHLSVRASELSVRGATAEQTVCTVGKGGELSVGESSIVYETETAVSAQERGAVVDVQHSILRAIPNGKSARRAFYLSNGATATVTHSVIQDAVRNAVLVARPGSSFVLDHSRVTGMREGIDEDGSRMAIALAAHSSGTLSVLDSTIADTEGTAVYVGEAKSELTRVVIEGVKATKQPLTGIGVLIEDGTLAMDGSTVTGCGDAALMFLGGEGLVSGNRFGTSKVGVHLQDVAVAEVDQARPNDGNEVVLAGNTFEEVGARLREERIDVGALSDP